MSSNCRNQTETFDVLFDCFKNKLNIESVFRLKLFCFYPDIDGSTNNVKNSIFLTDNSFLSFLTVLTAKQIR